MERDLQETQLQCHHSILYIVSSAAFKYNGPSTRERLSSIQRLDHTCKIKWPLNRGASGHLAVFVLIAPWKPASPITSHMLYVCVYTELHSMVQGVIQKGGEGFYQEGAGWAFAPPPLRNQNGNGHVGSCPPKNIQIVLIFP